MHKPIEVWFVLPRGSLILDWAGPAEAMRFANHEVTQGNPQARAAFRLRFAAPQPRPSVRSAPGCATWSHCPRRCRPRPGWSWWARWAPANRVPMIVRIAPWWSGWRACAPVETACGW
jgi:hypothetical protein